MVQTITTSHADYNLSMESKCSANEKVRRVQNGKMWSPAFDILTVLLIFLLDQTSAQNMLG